MLDVQETPAAPAFGPGVPMTPLPAIRRSKGLTGIKGQFPALLALLEVMRDGSSVEEAKAAIRHANPDLKSDNSLNAHLYTLRREFDLCSREGDRYVLTPRGSALLESQDPDVVADHLLTKVLGIDHVLQHLDDHVAATKAELLEVLRGAHDGWSSNFMPRAILGWLASLDLIAQRRDLLFALTPRGERWAHAITWQPERVTSSPSATVAPLQGSATAVHSTGVTASPSDAEPAVPTFDPGAPDILARLDTLRDGTLRLDQRQLSQLHAGLWSHPIRHFAVLTGLSGTGKTQLALRYARALCDVGNDDLVRTRVLSVQPGWYDPTPLLGYPHPVQEDVYRSAPFLETLLRALDDPAHPYVVILDEMNLSHPEQYLAPVLSAMETGGWLELHALDEDTVEVPRQVPYPPNLAIIGTLNMDETTHGLSDKVLDRAFTLEFWDITIDEFPGWAGAPVPTETLLRARALLNALGAVLAPVRLHFGWRTIDDVLGYLAFQHRQGLPATEALDDVVYAKILPKLRGEATERFCRALDATIVLADEHGLARCARKLRDLRADLDETGSARFWR